MRRIVEGLEYRSETLISLRNPRWCRYRRPLRRLDDHRSVVHGAICPQPWLFRFARGKAAQAGHAAVLTGLTRQNLNVVVDLRRGNARWLSRHRVPIGD